MLKRREIQPLPDNQNEQCVLCFSIFVSPFRGFRSDSRRAAFLHSSESDTEPRGRSIGFLSRFKFYSHFTSSSCRRRRRRRRRRRCRVLFLRVSPSRDFATDFISSGLALSRARARARVWRPIIIFSSREREIASLAGQGEGHRLALSGLRKVQRGMPPPPALFRRAKSRACIRAALLRRYAAT